MKKNDKIISYFLKQIISLLHDRILKVILFGSQARDDSTFESDYDCLVVFDKIDDNAIDILDTIAGDILFIYGSVISIFPINSEKLNQYRYDPLYLNIQQDGVTLWQKTA